MQVSMSNEQDGSKGNGQAGSHRRSFIWRSPHTVDRLLIDGQSIESMI